MGGLFAGLRIAIYNSLYFYGSPVIIKLEIIPIITGQACFITKCAGEEGDKAQTGEDNCLSVLASDKEQREWDEHEKEEGGVWIED